MTIPLIESLYEANQRRKVGLIFREISAYEKNSRIDLSSNSYLALQNCKEVTDEAIRLCNNQLYGNMASRLISQSSPLYEPLENELADWKRCESAMVFGSGYAANVGIIRAISGRGADIFCDRLNHASIIGGSLMSGARLLRYRHNDMSHLKDLLRSSAAARKLIVTDTVFSMDGDRALLNDICELGERFGCAIMVDEAHATGIFGYAASGLVEECGVENVVNIRVGTLSKAVAGLGGFFAGSCDIKDYLVNNAETLIYSTGLPHSALSYNLAAVRYIKKNPRYGKILLDKAKKLREALTDMGYDCMDSSTQIIPILTNDTKNALELSSYLRKNNIAAPAIRAPTVPKGKERVRFSIHLGIETEEAEYVIDVMKKYRG